MLSNLASPPVFERLKSKLLLLPHPAQRGFWCLKTRSFTGFRIFGHRRWDSSGASTQFRPKSMVDFVRVKWPFVRTILPSAAIRVDLVGEWRQVASGRHRAASGDRKIEHGVLGEVDFVAVQGGEPVSNDCGCPVKMMNALACWISLARIFRHD